MVSGTSGPLSPGGIDDFTERGWTLLRHAFPPTVARAVRRHIGDQIGIDLERPEDWTQPQVWLQKALREPPYTDALTERFHTAVDQLVGPGRWEMRPEMGWWPITFPGFGWPGVIEVVAEEGDVVLAHPLLFHSANPNHGARPRVMAQPAFSMTGRKNTDGDDLYPVEVPLARAQPSLRAQSSS